MSDRTTPTSSSVFATLILLIRSLEILRLYRKGEFTIPPMIRPGGYQNILNSEIQSFKKSLSIFIIQHFPHGDGKLLQ